MLKHHTNFSLLVNRMQNPQKSSADVQYRDSAGFIPFILGAAGCLALAATFLLASSNVEYFFKTVIFAGVTTLFVLLCIILFLFNRKTGTHEREISEKYSNVGIISEIESKLLALDEANQFFGSSLKPSDMFMLVCSRVAEIFPFAASRLLVPGENEICLKIVHAGGKNADELLGLEMGNNSLAGKAAASGSVEVDEDLFSERLPGQKGNLEGFRSSAAIPLIQDQHVFGVLQLYTDYKIKADENTICILEAIGERVAPIFEARSRLNRRFPTLSPIH